MKLGKGKILVLGFALFAMFFGAGNLIFPPTLGRLFGDQFGWSMMGFLLTGVGLPLFGILAVARADGGIESIASHIDAPLAKALSLVIILAIGPLFAIPRTCATTFELGIAPNIPQMSSWVFSFIYFIVVLAFSLNSSSVIDRIGKILTPVLLCALGVLIVRGIADPVSSTVSTGLANPFGKSLREGYQTMDLMAATVFGIVILNDLRSKGVVEKKNQIRAIVIAGLISATGLALVYTGLIYLGATAGSTLGDMTRTELLILISRNLLGQGGVIILGIAISAACLTTAIGLTTMCGEYFSELSAGKVGYKTICIIVSITSLVLANAGVDTIIKLAVPLLVSVYPVVMALVILCLIGRRLHNINIWRGIVLGAFSVGMIEALRSVGILTSLLDPVHRALPFSSKGIGWIIPAAILGVIGAFAGRQKKPKIASETGLC